MLYSNRKLIHICTFKVFEIQRRIYDIFTYHILGPTHVTLGHSDERVTRVTCSICWCQSCNFDLGGKIFPTLPRCSIISCDLYTFFTSSAYTTMYSSDAPRFHMKEHSVTEPKISIGLIDVWWAKYLRNILLLIIKEKC